MQNRYYYMAKCLKLKEKGIVPEEFAKFPFFPKKFQNFWRTITFHDLLSFVGKHNRK